MPVKYPLSMSTFDDKEFNSMIRVINSKNFTMGKKVKIFEKNFSKYIGSRFAIMVNSGSSANLLMVAALIYSKNHTLRKGDEVIAPATGWSTSYSPLLQYGIKIKFVDIDLATLNYDLSELKEAVTQKTKAILIVNVLGNPNDFGKINEIINGKNIIIIEDNCESLGASYAEKMAGSFGLLGSFSFFYSHHISTMEGGIVTTDNEELYQILLSLRAHGWTRDLPHDNIFSNRKNIDSLYDSYRFVLPGYNLRPTEIQGAIGIQQLKKLPKFINIRKRNAELFKKLMFNHEHLLMQEEIGSSSWFAFSLIIKPESNMKRLELLNQLTELGFEYRPILTGNFTKQEVLKYFDYEIHNNLDNANYLHEKGVYIGNYSKSMEDAFLDLSKL
tara:strand:- start:544 stop:1704 length:1161 start_codon:yes stop_codon:yes gene_type:complete